MSTGPQKATRFQVLHRDGWRCVCCGRPVMITDYSIHHRRARGMGGSRHANGLANLITLCGSGTTGCHGWVESHRTEAYDLGFLVRRNSLDDPEQVPITGAYGQFFLTDDGSVVPITREKSA